MNKTSFLLLIFVVISGSIPATCDTLGLSGLTVTPHVQSDEMRYRQEADFSLGARTELFIQNTSDQSITIDPATLIKLRGYTPNELLQKDKWTWYDFPDAWKGQSIKLKPGDLTVWMWNGKREDWGIGTKATLEMNDPKNEDSSPIQIDIPITEPKTWISSVTFLGDDGNPFPNQMIFHIANHSENSLKVESCRLWFPENNTTWRVLKAGKWHDTLTIFPKDGMIPPDDKGGAIIKTGTLPLTYTAIEVRLLDENNHTLSLWTHVRIKKEEFDISGGWISSNANGKSTLTYEAYLKTLKQMHINTGHIAEVDGYTNNDELYLKYPIKYFNKLENVEKFDTEEMLPRIHAVEFLGEPQYGGGKPVHPMDVWKELAPYQSTRLPTTVTHSEERIWRFYAGLSDYPHYDAYRVTAPSADSWSRYDRWGDYRIRWGAPLETIGVMTRSLRELNRPAPIAYWSQGAHHGWDRYGGRKRTSPTPGELRAQAYHALSARITSLYWFNLSLKSILAFPDLIAPIQEVGREIRLLEPYYLLGDAYSYKRVMSGDNPVWDISVIAGPTGALLFALDLSYQADPENKVFTFGSPKNTSHSFPLPSYLQNPKTVLKVNANTIEAVQFETTQDGIRIDGEYQDVNIFVVSMNPNEEVLLKNKRLKLVDYENAFEFDPGSNPSDLEKLKNILQH